MSKAQINHQFCGQQILSNLAILWWMWMILFGGLLFEFWPTDPCLCFTSHSYLIYHGVTFAALTVPDWYDMSHRVPTDANTWIQNCALLSPVVKNEALWTHKCLYALLIPSQSSSCLHPGTFLDQTVTTAHLHIRFKFCCYFSQQFAGCHTSRNRLRNLTLGKGNWQNLQVK